MKDDFVPSSMEVVSSIIGKFKDMGVLITSLVSSFRGRVSSLSETNGTISTNPDGTPIEIGLVDPQDWNA